MYIETKNYFFALIVLALAGYSFFSVYLAKSPLVGGISIEAMTDFPIASEKEVKLPRSKAGETELPTVSAKAVLIKDMFGTVLYSKNSSARLPIASLTKLMTAIVVKNRASLEEMVEVKSQDISVSPYKANLRAGERVLIRDLLGAMLISSANDAALALARHIGGETKFFVDYLNKEARQLGMKNSSFENPVGFDHASHFSTADDLSLLVTAFIGDSELMETVGQKEYTFYSVDGKNFHHVISTNKLLDQSSVLGIKTGYTNEAKGNIIILVAEPRYYLIILGSDGREADAQVLMKWVADNFIWN